MIHVRRMVPRDRLNWIEIPHMQRLIALVVAGSLSSIALGGAGAADRRAGWEPRALGTITPSVFDLAITAAVCAERAGSVSEPGTLTVIDYSKPSTQKRLWVFDLDRRELLYEELVSHGVNSGDNLATRFSNRPESRQSSLGLFVTGETYVGKNGYSLRLDGLEPGVNDRARERAIVMHGAPYVDPALSQTLGRLGRSWGCPAVRATVARALIDRVKGGGLVFAYAPDQPWLQSSPYLGGCAAAESANVTAPRHRG